MLFYNWQLLRVKTSHAQKTRFWYLLGVLLKTYDDQPRVPHPGQKGSLHQEYYEACQSPALVFVRL